MHLKYLLFVGLLALAISCKTSQKEAVETNRFQINHQGESVTFNSPAEITAWVASLLGPEYIEAKAANFEKVVDENGKAFPAIKGYFYTEDLENLSVIVPLKKISQDGKALYELTCLMSCRTKSGCSPNSLRILQACKNLSCNCEEGEDGASSFVLFFD